MSDMACFLSARYPCIGAQEAHAALARKLQEVGGELFRAQDDLSASAGANFEMAKRTREAQVSVCVCVCVCVCVGVCVCA